MVLHTKVYCHRYPTFYGFSVEEVVSRSQSKAALRFFRAYFYPKRRPIPNISDQADEAFLQSLRKKEWQRMLKSLFKSLPSASHQHELRECFVAAIHNYDMFGEMLVAFLDSSPFHEVEEFVTSLLDLQAQASFDLPGLLLAAALRCDHRGVAAAILASRPRLFERESSRYALPGLWQPIVASCARNIAQALANVCPFGDFSYSEQATEYSSIFYAIEWSINSFARTSLPVPAHHAKVYGFLEQHATFLRDLRLDMTRRPLEFASWIISDFKPDLLKRDPRALDGHLLKTCASVVPPLSPVNKDMRPFIRLRGPLQTLLDEILDLHLEFSDNLIPRHTFERFGEMCDEDCFSYLHSLTPLERLYRASILRVLLEFKADPEQAIEGVMKLHPRSTGALSPGDVLTLKRINNDWGPQKVINVIGHPQVDD
ncbi:MAG: hypothetical protein Q9162_001932 [Coniocarpon cinnabarinum]